MFYVIHIIRPVVGIGIVLLFWVSGGLISSYFEGLSSRIIRSFITVSYARI